MFLIFDTETTGLPRNWNAPLTDFDNWPRVVQLAWQIHDADGVLIEVANHIIKPEGFTIPFNASKIHGITTEFALQNGEPLIGVLEKFNQSLSKAEYIIGHNLDFDKTVLGVEYLRSQIQTPLLDRHPLDTCTELTATFCQLPGGKGGKFKLPTLEELHKKLFNEGFGDAHNASADVEATTRCFLELLRLGQFPDDGHRLDPFFIERFRLANPDSIKAIGLAIQANSAASPQTTTNEIGAETPKATTSHDHPFAHLRTHSTFTILNSTIDIPDLIKKAIKEDMPAVGLTDTNNLMAAFQFITAVNEYNKKENTAVEKGEKPTPQNLKAILGCEMYICRDYTDKTVKDNGFLVPFIAKNKTGYQNLSMLSSISFTEGFYYVPRINKELILKHKEGLIVTTGGLTGEIPSLLLNMGEQQAEEAIVWWKTHFGDDFFIELNRHGLPEEDFLNVFLLQMAEKYQIKYFAANNVHYLEKNDAEAHDLLICIKDNAKKRDPIGRGYGHRFGFQNDEYYFKSEAEMLKLFADLPQAIATIGEIIEKVESYELARPIQLPEFTIPEDFNDPLDVLDHGKRGENNYLRHLTIEGALKRYGVMTDEIQERIDFELATIERTGYPGYFLIVQDLIEAARKMGVWVGPGRGSAAGSLVAYCIKITNIDPLKYGLLFERFLNPERISMPDIDIDFDDEGRSKVIEYVTNKYGQNKVAQIITYGTLGTKSAIRDIGRALETDMAVINKLAASTNNIKLGDFYSLDKDKLTNKYRPEQMEAGESLKQKALDKGTESDILKNTLAIEGLVRNTGIHACGIVITPTDLRELVPVTVSKESNLWATQFDNAVAESAGLLKIDFLGLKTLSLIRDTIEIIKNRRQITIDPDTIPLDDEKTFKLFQGGETVGVFQYESPGMQKHLRDLKPSNFNDLIAMNALYRPGPIAYIPTYIKRKLGLEPISYDLDITREILEETYGVTVYQEQVMLLSQKLSNFTKGQADLLRKAMGKKNPELLQQLHALFVSNGTVNGHSEKVLEKIWSDWISFANYAFNKSHSTCYAFIAFQTAYLKANYPAEFMAAVLSNNIGDIKQVTFFMEECKRMKVKVLGPDVNESAYKFTVNEKGEVRFGLGAIKNMGEAAAGSILEERISNGHYKSVFDFLVRSNLRSINKRNIEALATSGAFDSFEGIHRAQFFYKEGNDNQSFLEKLIRNATQTQEAKNSAQINLFGEVSEVEVYEPPFPQCDRWSKMRELQEELDSIGFYISAHPMDSYKIPIRYFTNTSIQQINASIQEMKGHQLKFAAQVTSAEHLTSQQGNNYCRFKVEDHNAGIELMVFSELYLKIKHLIDPGLFVLINASPAPSYRDKEKMELKINDIQLLDRVVETSGRTIYLKLDVNRMTDDDLLLLQETIQAHLDGKNPYSIQFIDHTNKMLSTLTPKKGRLNANHFLPLVDAFDFVSYDLK